MKNKQLRYFTDASGKKIFEGDVLDNNLTKDWIIAYVDNSVEGCCGMPIGWYEQRDNFESWRQIECGESFKIKRNIHLLKER